MKISIVIPSFNSESTIERTIRSIVSQEWDGLDLILMDGGSRDRTLEIVSGYRRYFAHVVSEKDRGQSHAINKGFALSSGDILGWLCSDDELLPGALAEIARLAEAHPDAGVFAGVSRRVFADGTSAEYRPEANAFDIITHKNTIDQPATYWRRSYHSLAGGVDESYHYAMDWDWWNRLRRAGARLVTTDRILANYYFSAENKTSSAPQGNLDETYRLLKKYGPLDGHLADVYMYLFKNYDMAGCYDNPPTASPELMKKFYADLKVLTAIFGESLIYTYNWNWMSKQLRGRSWHQ